MVDYDDEDGEDGGGKVVERDSDDDEFVDTGDNKDE
jgi:hypothetical protein